jgi:hypothetical protein
VEAQIETLLATVEEDIPVSFRLCDVSKEMQPLKLGKACGFDGIPNECIRNLPRTPLVHSFIQSLPSAWSLPSTLEVSKNYKPAETRQRPEISP